MMVCEKCLRARNKKPCEGWINCNSYTDQEKQFKRLLEKETPAEILEWYSTSYRGESSLSDFISSG